MPGCAPSLPLPVDVPLTFLMAAHILLLLARAVTQIAPSDSMKLAFDNISVDSPF